LSPASYELGSELSEKGGLSHKITNSNRWLLLLLVIGLLLVACGGNKGRSPTQAVRSFIESLETFDAATAKSLVCEQQRNHVENSLAPFGDVSALGETFAMSLEDMSYQELSNDGEVAVVLVQGQMRLSFLGQEQTQEIKEEHIVIKQDGRWLICDSHIERPDDD
jgi:hypothetical protein